MCSKSYNNNASASPKPTRGHNAPVCLFVFLVCLCSRVAVCVREAKCRTTLKTLLHLAPQGALYPSRSKSKSNFASVCSVIVSVLVKLTISTSDSSRKKKKTTCHRATTMCLSYYIHIPTALRALFRIFLCPFCLPIIAAQEMAESKDSSGRSTRS